MLWALVRSTLLLTSAHNVCFYGQFIKELQCPNNKGNYGICGASKSEWYIDDDKSL